MLVVGPDSRFLFHRRLLWGDPSRLRPRAHSPDTTRWMLGVRCLGVSTDSVSSAPLCGGFRDRGDEGGGRNELRALAMRLGDVSYVSDALFGTRSTAQREGSARFLCLSIVLACLGQHSRSKPTPMSYRSSNAITLCSFPISCQFPSWLGTPYYPPPSTPTY